MPTDTSGALPTSSRREVDLAAVQAAVLYGGNAGLDDIAGRRTRFPG